MKMRVASGGIRTHDTLVHAVMICVKIDAPNVMYMYM